jgi:hypothetical protein
MLQKLAITILAITLFAGTAFAADKQVSTTNVIEGATLSGFSPTRQVSVGYVSDGATSMDRYTIAAKHEQGNKIYGTTSAQTSNFQKDGTPGSVLEDSDIPDAPGSSSDTTIPEGWSAM